MSYRLAIAISGAVSLGSYEAGVMFEIIRAIGQHNSRSREDEKIHIDVLTGASAGGMTAAILAQKLMFEGNGLGEADSNDLYAPWVETADVKDMLREFDGDDPDKSILSSGFIEKIAQTFLLDRYKTSSPGSVSHPAAADSIRLGLAMSNLNGVDYRLPAFDGAELADPGGEFTYTRFQDRLTTTIDSHADTLAFWQKVAVAARSCGAFPFAFRALHVPRYASEEAYDDAAIDPGRFSGDSFTYTDGGVFNNSPLGMAKMLADQIDVDAVDYERRFYLYISPDRKTGTPNLSLNEGNASMLAVGRALVGAIFQQGRFQDWVTAAHYNELIDQFDDRAARLCGLMGRIKDSERKAMDGVADKLLEHIYETHADDAPDRASDFARLKKQFMEDDEAKQLLADKGEAAVDAWIKSVQVLEQSGRLGSKDKMHIYTITAGDDELAGEGMSAFAGFFDRRFRDFDYNQGRKKARAFLSALKGENGNKGHMPLTAFEFTDSDPASPRDLSRASLGDVDKQVRKDIRERFSDRAERMLKQAGANWVVRKGAMWLFINGKLKKALEL